MIFAGALTEVLDFYHIVETQSDSGYKETSEQHYMTRKAERTKVKERLVVDANEVFHSNELKFRLRNCPEMLETDIVVYKHERYRITSIESYPRDGEMVIIIDKINE